MQPRVPSDSERSPGNRATHDPRRIMNLNEVSATPTSLRKELESPFRELEPLTKTGRCGSATGGPRRLSGFEKGRAGRGDDGRNLVGVAP